MYSRQFSISFQFSFSSPSSAIVPILSLCLGIDMTAASVYEGLYLAYKACTPTGRCTTQAYVSISSPSQLILECTAGRRGLDTVPPAPCPARWGVRHPAADFAQSAAVIYTLSPLAHQLLTLAHYVVRQASHAVQGSCSKGNGTCAWTKKVCFASLTAALPVTKWSITAASRSQ